MSSVGEQPFKLDATASQWKDFFMSFLWRDIQSILANDYELGVEELSNPATVDINKIQFARGRIDYIQYLVNLPSTVEQLLAERLEEREDSHLEESIEKELEHGD